MNTTAEFLRRLADLIDLADTNASSAPAPAAPVVPIAPPVITKIEVGGNEDNFAEHNSVPSETEVMVPPLQQKIELLKKVAGVESVYDENEDEPNEIEEIGDTAGPTEEEELSAMKKNAGIIVASDDFPE